MTHRAISVPTQVSNCQVNDSGGRETGLESGSDCDRIGRGSGDDVGVTRLEAIKRAVASAVSLSLPAKYEREGLAEPGMLLPPSQLQPRSVIKSSNVFTHMKSCPISKSLPAAMTHDQPINP